MRSLRISPEASLLLLVLGIFLVFVGIIVLSMSFLPVGRIEGGGLIIIGPFPIILHGKFHPIALLLMLTLPILAFILLPLYLLSRMRSGEEAG
ncbi:hypothetical protein DRO29_05245 [Candidatus Bathyarchaeota archaeon]|nr:MAG: hypothetical protein DRO29_05245 [Candidatus Bathyarchaeota archaeon]